METITISKDKFSKLLSDVDLLMTDVEDILSNETEIVKKRRAEIESGEVKGISEADYYAYLKKRGINVN